MTRLIIGCGYLGGRVAALWLAQGHRVHAATRRPDQADVFRTQGFEPVVCDVHAADSLKRLPAVDTVLYAVGFDRAAGATMRSTSASR